MSVEIEDLGEVKKAGGGGGGKKAAKAAQVFVQATSTVNSMSATKTGKSLQFWHGQRGVRKKTPAVNGVFPGVYTDGEEPIMLWDGVNLFKHYSAKPDDMEQGLQKCERENEGDYSLSGVSMQLSAWPRGDGCHKPDTTVRVVEKDKEKVWYSDELHKAFEHSHEFDAYSFDCVNGISVTSTAYNFFMTAQQDCFCPGIMAVAGRLSAAAENGIYVGARDLEALANIEGVPVDSVVDEEFLKALGKDFFKLGQPVINVELPPDDDDPPRTSSQQTMADVICAVYLLKSLLPPCDTPDCAAYAYDVGDGKTFRFPPTLKCCWSSSVNEAVCTLLSAMLATPVPAKLPTKSVSQQDLASFLWQTISPVAALMGCNNPAAAHKWYVAEAMTVILGPTHWLLTKLLENGVSTHNGLKDSKLIEVENSAEDQRSVCSKDATKPGAALQRLCDFSKILSSTCRKAVASQ